MQKIDKYVKKYAKYEKAYFLGFYDKYMQNIPKTAKYDVLCFSKPQYFRPPEHTKSNWTCPKLQFLTKQYMLSHKNPVSSDNPVCIFARSSYVIA